MKLKLGIIAPFILEIGILLLYTSIRYEEIDRAILVLVVVELSLILRCLSTATSVLLTTRALFMKSRAVMLLGFRVTLGIFATARAIQIVVD